MNLAKFSEIFDKKKTFRPKKKFQPGTMKYSLHKQAQASLNSGINLRQVVKLPKGEDFNDWLAVHVVDFFNRINLIYGTVCEQVSYCESLNKVLTHDHCCSAPERVVPPCQGGPSLNISGKMVQNTRNPLISQLLSTFHCWWTGSSLRSMMKM